MRVLLTGAAGFVGLNIVEALLARGHEVVASDLAAPPAEAAGWACRWTRLDVADPAAVLALFEAERPDAVVHGAAITAGPERERRDPGSIVAVNLGGTLNVIAAAARHRPRRLLYFSSSSIYGENGFDDMPLDEGRTHPVPEALYAITKYAGERAALRARTLHGLDVVCARLSSAFGPWERDTGHRDTLSPLWQATALARAGGEAVLEREGWRDWVHGRDIADAAALLLEAERPRHGVYNIGPGEPWTVAEWCERLAARLPGFRWRIGAPANVLLHAARDRNPLSIARLREEFGWRPRFGLDAAFEDYLAWLEGEDDVKPRMLGDIHLSRVLETELPELDPKTFFLAYSEEALAPHRHWLEPDAIDPATGLLRIAVQSYIVRSGRHVVLIDTCVGEHKEREFLPDWNMRSGTSYLADLAKAGVRPEEVTHVMCTHLHPDHVGWNTRLIDGRWVPTFPNAQYVFARKEYEFWEPKWRRDPRKFGDGCFGDSVLPVMEAGQAVLVAEDHAIDDSIWLEPTPGHSAGHTAIHMRSKGQDAVMSGDLIHSPVQLVFPEWSTRGCLDKALSAVTRRGFLERYCDSGALVLTAHFPSPSIGWVTRAGDAFGFRYAEG